MRIAHERAGRKGAFRVRVAAHHVLRDTAHGDELRIGGGFGIGGLNDLDNAERLGRQIVGHQIAGELQP